MFFYVSGILNWLYCSITHFTWLSMSTSCTSEQTFIYFSNQKWCSSTRCCPGWHATSATPTNWPTLTQLDCQQSLIPSNALQLCSFLWLTAATYKHKNASNMSWISSTQFYFHDKTIITSSITLLLFAGFKCIGYFSELLEYYSWLCQNKEIWSWNINSNKFWNLKRNLRLWTYIDRVPSFHFYLI